MQRIQDWWNKPGDGLTGKEKLEMQRFYASATGSVLTLELDGTVRVGRFMSPQELEAMQTTGRLQQSLNGGVTSVSHPANPATYRAALLDDMIVLVSRVCG